MKMIFAMTTTDAFHTNSNRKYCICSQIEDEGKQRREWRPVNIGTNDDDDE